MLIKFMLNQTICLKPTCNTSLGRNFLCVASSYISPRNQRNPCCFPISEIRFLACLGLFITTINKSRPEGWLHLKNAFLSDRISGLSPMLSRHIFNAKNYLLKWRKQNSCAVINHWPQAGHSCIEKKMETLSSLHLWLLTQLLQWALGRHFPGGTEKPENIISVPF